MNLRSDAIPPINFPSARKDPRRTILSITPELQQIMTAAFVSAFSPINLKDFAIGRFWLNSLVAKKIAMAILNSFYVVFGQYQPLCQI